MNEENTAEAVIQLASRIEDLKAFNTLPDDYEHSDDISVFPELAKILEQQGEPTEYGLSVEVDSISPRYANATFAYVLSTGGPHEEFQITIDNDNVITGVSFVSLPWFDRVELELTQDQQETVINFTERFLYLDYEYALEQAVQA